MGKQLSHSRERGNPDRSPEDHFRLLVALLLVMLAGWALVGAARPTHADEELTLNIKVGNASSEVAAASSSCAEFQVGQAFSVDVRVENVDDLMAYELRISYDGTVLALEDADFEHFLLSTPPTGQIFPSLFEAETANRFFIAAADTKGSPDSGSGVLVRLQMRAIGEGMSEIGIQTDPTVFGPRLTNSKGDPIADATGDRIFDGPVQNGTAAVNADCSSSGGDDGTDPGSGGNDTEPSSEPQDGTGDGSSDSGDGSVVVTEGDGRDDEGAGASGGGGSGAGTGGDSTDGGSDSSNEGTDTEDGGSLSGASSAADSSDGLSLGPLWYALIVLTAIAVLATLGLVIRSLRAP